MQKDGTWTWDKFDELMGKCQRDTDNDGTDDVYGLTLNESNMTNVAVFSNGGSYVGKDDKGYFYNLEAPETVEALEWVVKMFDKYDNHDPEHGQRSRLHMEYRTRCCRIRADRSDRRYMEAVHR